MKIELRDISMRFGNHAVLDHITAKLDFAHCLALIGPSGGGKSTLLRLLAGLQVPYAGSILVDNLVIPTDPDSLRLYRSRLGIVFQSFNLFPHLSARENIRLPLLAVHHLTVEETDSRAQAVLERFQLSAHADKRPAELSGGQRQRIAIARALAIEPQLLLFDEPTSALDPEMTAEVLDVISELRSSGQPLVLVTHAMGFARETADLVAFVANGSLREINPPDAFFDHPRNLEVRRFLSRVLRY